MKFSLRQDTLAYQLSRPGVVPRSMTGIASSNVAAQIGKFRKLSDVSEWVVVKESICHPMGDPEHDALTFYMMNHAVATIRQRVHVHQPLGVYLPVLQAYHQWLSILSARMFFYMVLICTRESRHVHNSMTDTLFTGLAKKYGQGCVDFNQSIKGEGSDAAANKFVSNPPAVTIGNYTAYLADNFNQGQYSSSFGGKAWGKVAEVLRDFVHGKLSAEMMMDTAFTLCHNNGPIFNKGMLFKGYTSRIYKILDVQRSGQIPQFMVGEPNIGPTNTSLLSLVRQAIPDFTQPNHVDWFLVEELGALKSYTTEQQQQVSKYGYPPKHKAKIEAAQLKASLAQQAAAKEAKMMVEIHPGCVIKKIEVVR